jgi:hypothetical protein
MAGKNTAVFGIYASIVTVESGVDALQRAGFRNTDISVLLPENAGSEDFAHQKDTKAPEGATAGAGTGADSGALWGGWPALALSPFLASDPLSPPVQSWVRSPERA